ncbi:hypothetical protein SLEP1_g5218 [Rubroshorea leprosula]|uniref:Uncharacterized protein n=1 Tax=Rubroshorea leprosula TaxID=152421 RepID=A0AAV5HVK4_9ROSI|nr:hypothetical protein SLEP1_g5218 [Rubroshorea leprosula]
MIGLQQMIGPKMIALSRVCSDFSSPLQPVITSHNRSLHLQKW